MDDPDAARFLITPPPGLLPRRPPSPEDPDADAAADRAASADGAVPVSTGSSTRKLEWPRPARAGAPASPPGSVAPPESSRTTPSSSRASSVGSGTAADPTVDDSTVLSVATRRWQLELPDGGRVTLTPAGVILGRDPIAFPRWPDAELVKVADPGRSLSKTHAALVLGPTGPVVTDLGSTNGVVLDSGGIRTPVSGSDGTPIPDGATIELGDLSFPVRYG